MEEVQWSVSARESTLNKLIEQEKALEHSFLESIGENNKFKDFLLKVFRKKIKRAKRKQEEESKEGGAEGDDDEGSEDESDSDYLRWKTERWLLYYKYLLIVSTHYCITLLQLV